MSVYMFGAPTGHLTAQDATEMTANQFRAALDRLGLTQGGAAELLGVSIRTVHGYANKQRIPRAVELLLNILTGDVKPSEVLG